MLCQLKSATMCWFESREDVTFVLPVLGVRLDKFVTRVKIMFAILIALVSEKLFVTRV